MFYLVVKENQAFAAFDITHYTYFQLIVNMIIHYHVMKIKAPYLIADFSNNNQSFYDHNKNAISFDKSLATLLSLDSVTSVTKDISTMCNFLLHVRLTCIITLTETC